MNDLSLPAVIPRLARTLTLFPPSLALLILATTTLWAATDSRTVKRQFGSPPRAYATAPLWVWNDDLTENQIRQTLRDLASQNVRQAFVHPRPGLMTPYLSSDWFRLWKIALDEAARLDLNLWIYDENSYPSGFAGGWVPESMPASRGRGLQLRVTPSPPVWTDATLEVFRLDRDRAIKTTADARNGASLPDGQYLAASVIRAPNSPWHGNRSYVDLLYPGVTEQFLEITLEAYRREIGEHFGSRIPGIFTDEPHITPAGGLPWTDDLPEVFRRRWGYSLPDHFPSLTQEIGDWRRVRHNYLQVLLELFIDRWAKPYYDRSAQYGLEFTGHYWEHEWPNCLIVPDNMALSAWQQRPGIDTLMNRYEEHTHAQFGNVRAAREITSLANQLGRNRTLCEVYGAGGWDLRFEDMKRIGDWLAVLGINTFNEHLSYVTLRGARKRDHPQSFSYHEPWWDSYHVIARYLSRLSLALAHGEQVNRILVLEPTTSAWMYNAGTHASAQLSQIGDRFFQLLLSLEQRQIPYDLGCEDVLARHASVHDRFFRVGQRDYDIVVLPPHTENLNAPTFKLLDTFLRQGGSVLAVDSIPNRVNGSTSDSLPSLAAHPGWRTLNEEQTLQSLAQPTPNTRLTLTRAPDDRGILFHHRREFTDGQLLFLANTNIEEPASGTIAARAGAVEQWDPLTGEIRAYPWIPTPAGLMASFELPPSGSLLLFLPSENRKQPKTTQLRPGVSLPPSAPTELQRLGPNVLTLDYVTITAGTETLTNAYFYAASQFAFRKNGMNRNPWDSAVQFRDELISITFPADSGFTATYQFTIAGPVPPDLEAVVERPDLYTITCNGVNIVPSPGRWWLDRAFGRLSLDHVARSGSNELTLKAAPFRIKHEVEPVYLLGSFTLHPADSGFTIAPDQPLALSPTDPTLSHHTNPDHPAWLGQGQRPGWNVQGHPFYAEGVAYRQSYNIKRKRDAYRVALGAWHGSVAKVFVNQKLAGHILAPPWDYDVTPHIQRGPNTIEIVVIGTLKNTLGPHHGNPGVGSAWPGMFQHGPNPGPPPGAQYHTLGYGLFEPFVLVEADAAK
jgi:hypothetical protein